VNSKYLYLFLNIATFTIPFLFSFYPKANFSKKWKYDLPAILFTAIVFMVWDELFTRMGIWGFNRAYVSGVFILNLPIEEVLFFLCIPYACLFTYFAFNYLITKDYLATTEKTITIILIATTLTVGIYFNDRWYTSVTMLSLALFLSFYRLILRRSLGRFYFAFIILLIPFFAVNGILTGSLLHDPIVWYNPSEIIGVRLGTIPVEDIFYALLMILSSIAISETLERIAINKKKAQQRASINSTNFL
jgi:lycopene cyclase domain-containing protein